MLKGDQWLAHSYTVSVSKLDSTFATHSPSVQTFAELTTKMQNRALEVIGIGKAILAPILQRPSRACARFHPCSKLIDDHNLFNLKPVEYAEKTVNVKDAKRRPTTPIKFSPVKKLKSMSSKSSDDESLQQLQRCEDDLAKANRTILALQTQEKFTQSATDSKDTEIKRMKADQAKFNASNSEILGGLRKQID